LKYNQASFSMSQCKSLPTRGAWIEIAIVLAQRQIVDVAPHTGSVD